MTYKWLSSAGKPFGCGSGSPVHVAGTGNTEVWVTEGILKADIAALRLGRMVLAVAGVSQWSGVLPIVRRINPNRVIVAFDTDKAENQAVKTHSEALIQSLLKQGFRTFEADWNTQFKGLDDLLTAPIPEQKEQDSGSRFAHVDEGLPPDRSLSPAAPPVHAADLKIIRPRLCIPCKSSLTLQQLISEHPEAWRCQDCGNILEVR
jgi:hypothetical protein